MELLEFCVKENNYFSFRGKFFKQNQGLAMGNPLSPILADIVLEKLFYESLNKLDRKPTFIKKYVDDIILAIPSNYVNQLKTIFESFDNNIRFTVEYEIENKINFLDITLIRNNNKIITNWFRKTTASGRLLNYLSDHPFKMKNNIVVSLIKRVLHISDTQFISDNLSKIYKILIDNNYPEKLIENSINIVMNQRNNNTIIQQHNNTPNIRTIFGSITYIPYLTEKIQKIFKKDNTIIKIANKPTNKLNDVFSKLKDPIHILKSDNVVYEFPCVCGKVYIGQTGQILNKRLCQHKNNIKNKIEKSAVVEHYKKQEHEYNFDKVRVLHKEKNWQKREFLEQAEIYLNHKTINKKADFQSLNFHYRNILYTHKKITQKSKNKR